MDFTIILIAVGVTALFLFGLSCGRMMTDGGWHTVRRHTRCGYFSRWSHEVDERQICPSCGEKIQSHEIEKLIARATWPLGYEFKAENKPND